MQQSTGRWNLPGRSLRGSCEGVRCGVPTDVLPKNVCGSRVCLLRGCAQSALTHFVECLLSKALLDDCFLSLAFSLLCQKVMRFLNYETIVSTFQELQVIQPCRKY